MNQQIKDILSNQTMSMESLGIPSNIAYVSALESMIDTLTETLAKRDKTIKEMAEKAKLVDCLEHHTSECACWDSSASYQCVNTFVCGFPHVYSGSNHCPQCGFAGARVR